MKLFIKSLPPDCHFQIVSFGDNYVCMVLKKKEYVHAYNESTVEEALRQINGITADMGGTEIFAPLKYSVNELSKHQKETRIFLLTDGDVNNPEKVIDLANTRNDNIRIHTFGIGSGCNKHMVQMCAKNGRGSCSLVKDEDTNLKGTVIKALQRASEPSLKNCVLLFGNKTI